MLTDEPVQVVFQIRCLLLQDGVAGPGLPVRRAEIPSAVVEHLDPLVAVWGQTVSRLRPPCRSGGLGRLPRSAGAALLPVSPCPPRLAARPPCACALGPTRCPVWHGRFPRLMRLTPRTSPPMASFLVVGQDGLDID